MKYLVILFTLIFSTGYICAEDYSFEIPSAEKKSEQLELSGNLDTKYSVIESRKTSPIYRLQFNNQGSLSDILSSYRLEFYLNGDYQTKNIDLHIKTHSEYYNDAESNFKLFELYGNINLSENSYLQAGKKMYNWGKGYAFNPVGYINPYKNPENPELLQTGILAVTYEYIKSLESKILPNISFTFTVIPAEELLNNKLSEIKNTDIAVKLYALLLDTDIDLMGYYNDIKTNKIGFDFSKNIKENIELHAELSCFTGQEKYSIANNNLNLSLENGSSYLLGFRWLNQWNTTIIGEYYFNGSGLNAEEYQSYSQYLLSAADSENVAMIQQALGFSKNYFSDSNLMREYLYFKISQPEPFNWLYFTPAIYLIYNLIDKSYSVGIPLSYKPVTNFEFLLWPVFIAGERNTEFGDKQVKNKIELWARFYF